MRGDALMFEAKVDGKALTGCDFIRTNSDGLIEDFMVMVRPLSAAQALSEQMAAGSTTSPAALPRAESSDSRM